MGVFYQTDKSRFTDFVVKLPENLMLKAIDFHNKGVQSTQQQALNYLQKQYQTYSFAQKDLDKYYQEKYGKSFRQILDEVYQNPDNWKKYRQDLQKLGYQLTEDELRGQIAKWTRPYQEYLAKAKEYSELVKKGKYNEDTFTLWNLYTLQRAKEMYEQGGRSPESLTFSNEFGMPETKDAAKYLEEQLKNKFGEMGKTLVRDEVTGKYIVRTKTGYEEVVDYSRIFNTSMRLMGFEYDDKSKSWYMAELNDVGRYYWQRAYWNKYVELRSKADNPEGIKEAEEKAREYANKIWLNIAVNKSKAMAGQFQSGKVIDEVTYKELDAHKEAVKKKTEEAIGDLSSTKVSVDVIPDKYFNRKSVDDYYSMYHNKFTQGLWKRDVDANDAKVIEDALREDKSPEHFETVIDDLYKKKEISYDTYIKLKQDYETYQKYKSSYNASRNYALGQLKSKYGDDIADKYSKLINGQSVEYTGDVVHDGVTYHNAQISLFLKDDKLYAKVSSSDGHVIEYEVDKDDIKKPRGEIIQNYIPGPAVALFNASKEYNQHRDYWFKENRDAGQTKIIALDISSIDGTNHLLTNSLGKRIVSNLDNIYIVNPNNALQSLANVDEGELGEYKNAAMKVLAALTEKKGAKTQVKTKDGKTTTTKTVTDNISNYMQVVRVYDYAGEKYAVLRFSTDQLQNLGLKPKEIDALKAKDGLVHIHIDKDMHIDDDILSYMDRYEIKPIDEGSKKIIENWKDPLLEVKEKGYDVLYKYKERVAIGMEPTASGTVPIPTGDYFEIEPGENDDTVTLRFMNEYGESVYEDVPLGNAQNVIDDYVEYAYILGSANIAVTRETIETFVDILKKNNGDKKKALEEMKKIMQQQQQENQ